MATVTETPKLSRLNVQSFIAYADLRTKQYLAVKGVGAASGKTQVDVASTGGERIVGILLNTPNVGEIAEVAVDPSTAPWIASGTFNCDVQLTTDTAGKAKAATTGDYVAGVSKEAALAANHVVATQLKQYKI